MVLYIESGCLVLWIDYCMLHVKRLAQGEIFGSADI